MTTAERGSVLADTGRMWAHRDRVLISVGVALVVGVMISQPLLGLAFLAVVGAIGSIGFLRRDVAPLVLFIGVLFITSPRHQFAVFKLPAGIIVALAITALWFLGRLAVPTPATRGDRAVTFTLVAFVGVLLTSYVVGIARPLRFAQLEAADRDVMILIAFFGVAMLVSDIGQTRRVRVLIATLLVLGAGVSAVAGLLQQAISFDLTDNLRLPGFRDAGLFTSGRERLGFTRAHGTARHPIEFGTSLAVALPFGLHLAAFGESRRVRRLAVVVSVVIVLGMAVSLSRSAIAALFAMLLVLAPTWPKRRRRAALYGSAALAGAMYLWQPARVRSALELITDWRGEEIDGANIAARTGDYELVAALVARFPLLGEGYGTHISFAPDNEYLDMVIETGFIGLVAMFAVLLVPFVTSGRRRTSARAEGDEAEADFAAAVQASVAAAIVSLATFDGFSFPQFSFSMFIVIGLAGAITRHVPGGSSSQRAAQLDVASRPQRQS